MALLNLAYSAFQEALRSKGLKDDTTCLVVDITSSYLPLLPPIIPRKKPHRLSSFFSLKKIRSSKNKSKNELSAVGFVEELFEEGSAMLAER